MQKWWWCAICLMATAWAAPSGNFAWESTQKVTEQESSLVYSPHSARATLRLLYDGGATELGPVCQFQGEEPPLKSVGWQSAQAVFLGQGVNAPPKYPAGVRSLDFSKATACNEINDWVSQQTAGHIQSLVTRQDLPASTAVVALSAVYLKSTWVQPFDPKLTRKQPFFPKGTVEMMNQTNSFGLYHDPEFTILELPYKEGQLVFDCCLPVREDGLQAVRRRLTATNLETIWGVLGDSHLAVQVALPKFRLQTRLDLLNFLNVPDPISLPGFSIGNTRLDVLVQQANLEVDEVGTVASAATAAVVSRSLPEAFVADHPFLFWIRDRSNGTVLFSGQFCGN